MNRVELSDDRRYMTVTDPEGRKATLRSALPGGFTLEHEAKALEMSLTVRPGQERLSRRVALLGRVLYLHIQTGPPTWWLPRVEVTRRSVMTGWFRGLVALSWG